MDMPHEYGLLGDIGATNVRFALLSNGQRRRLTAELALISKRVCAETAWR